METNTDAIIHSDLEASTALKSGASLATTRRVLETYFELLEQGLYDGKPIRLKKIGTLRIAVRKINAKPARQGLNGSIIPAQRARLAWRIHLTASGSTKRRLDEKPIGGD